MAAETRASQIVAEARTGTKKNRVNNNNFTSVTGPASHTCSGRGERMKQAKTEAKDLIDAYRSEKQEEFNNMVLSKGGSEGSASTKLQNETAQEIDELQKKFSDNKGKAIDVLLSKCCEVSLEVPTARVRATQKAAGVVS